MKPIPGPPVKGLDAAGVRREMLGNPKYNQREVKKLLARLEAKSGAQVERIASDLE